MNAKTAFTELLSWSTTHDAHRAIRLQIQQFFSKPGLTNLEDRIADRVKKAGTRLEEFSNTGIAVNLHDVFKSLVSGN